MPLYDITIHGYVVADHREEAKRVVLSDMDLSGCDVEIYETHTVDAHWADLIPFGDQENERTCMQILRGDDDDDDEGGHS